MLATPKLHWLGAMVGSLALFATACSSEPAEPRAEPERPAATATPLAPEKPGKPVTLSFAGDIHFEGDLPKLLRQPARTLTPIQKQLSSADFTMANLESAITTRGTPDEKDLEEPSRRYHFRTDGRALSALAAGGIDLLTMANNHGADFGAVGLADTLKARSKSPVPIVGVGMNRSDAFKPHEVNLKGTPFAFYGVDASKLESTNPTWQAGPAHPGLAFARGEGRGVLLNAVATKAPDAVVVVYLHWGDEGADRPTQAQKDLARDLADAGADVVVGSHAHRLQGSGWRGHTYVNYGLGNFIWYHGSVPESGLLTLTIQEGEVVKDSWAPATIPRYGGLPRFTTGKQRAAALTYWRGLRASAELSNAPRTGSFPTFKSSVSKITPALARRMKSSYRAGCPVPLKNLRYIELSHFDFGGTPKQGELVVAASEVPAVLQIFRKLYQARYPIERMELVSDYGGNDDRSMAANNSSAFNCRSVANTDRWSEHSYGKAIDLNPLQNPYVVGDSIMPPEGERFAFIERQPGTEAPKGAIVDNDAAVRAFEAAGWVWGGDWVSSKDYQHFSASGS